MNDFIEITNKVIADKLKDKIKINIVEYSNSDGMFAIKVGYYDNSDPFLSRGFRFSGCNQAFTIVLKTKFEEFINNLFMI